MQRYFFLEAGARILPYKSFCRISVRLKEKSESFLNGSADLIQPQVVKKLLQEKIADTKGVLIVLCHSF